MYEVFTSRVYYLCFFVSLEYITNKHHIHYQMATYKFKYQNRRPVLKIVNTTNSGSELPTTSLLSSKIYIYF